MNSIPPNRRRQPAQTAMAQHQRVAPAPEVRALAGRLPNLEVIELIGHGGMGEVYKGRQPLLDREVAIKVLRGEIARDELFKERFLREARALARLLHPYIVTVFDFGQVDDLYYLVMEYVDGANLRQLLRQDAISPRDVLDFMPQIAEALQNAHEAGVVHRDVKPENVLVDRKGRVRLVDFGLATLLAPAAPSTADAGYIAGTLGYMAPEQINAPETVDHRADIYSSGVVFYEMLTGELPRRERVPPSVKAATDQRLDPIVLRALQHDREQRYQQMRQVRVDLIAVTRTPESTVSLERTVAAPAEQLFAAWTTPSEMTRWYAPSDDFATPIAESDPRSGGRYRLAMQRNDWERPHVVSGQYCRVDPPHTLSFTWAWESPTPDPHETQVTIEFQPLGDATNVKLTHERFRDDAKRNDHAQGWQGCLNRLAQKYDR